MSRASTLLLALLILNALLGTLCLVVGRGERKSAALRLWGWGILLYSAGLLITIPPVIPLALRKIVGNAMIAYAPILTTGGVLSNTRFRLSRRWTTIAFLASVIPIVINHLGAHPLVLVDFLAPAPIANVLFLIAAVVLVRDPIAEAKSASRFLAALMLFTVVVWTLRMISILTSVGATNDRDRADLVVALFAIAQIVAAVATTLGLLWIEVRKMEAALRHLADTDALTGLPNRRATVARFGEEAARAARHDLSLAMVVFDVDHFKRVNDTYGHLAGDAALRHVAAVLANEKRTNDVVGRIGGEEFVVILPEEDATGAAIAANRLREAVATAPLAAGGAVFSVTISGGIGVIPQDGRDWDAVFAAADHRLYAAKEGGRNRVVECGGHAAAVAV
jgi:diguanylate cyclase (GGDEF)-like protein